MTTFQHCSVLRHICVAGNIGVGKTTLTKLLSDYYYWTPYFEEENKNPYLVDFYNQMDRWSFHLQIHFLYTRVMQIESILAGSTIVIQDRSIYEDVIFATNLHEMGLMSKRDVDTYLHLFSRLKKQVQPPNLLIFLKASISTLVEQIEKRGREYEKSIRIDYLKRLNEHYHTWISNYKEGDFLIIDCDQNKFASKESDLKEIIKQIDDKLS